MRGLLLGADGLELRDDLAMPSVDDGEVRVRVRLAGICGTDLAMREGYAGFAGIPGHEFVGELGDGRRVVGAINIGCGVCAECRGHGPAHCANRRVLGIRGHDGAFAEYLTLPRANLHAVPDGVDDRVATFAEPLAAALRVLDQVGDVTGWRAAVIGPGRLGLLVAQVLRGAGAEVTVIGHSAASRVLPEAMGLRVVADVDAGGVDLVVETSGAAAGLDRALDAVRPRGTVVLKSTYGTPPAVDLSRVVINELRLIGSRCGPVDRALAWLAEGRVEVEAMIDAVYPLPAFAAAFRRAAEPGVRKVLLDPRRRA